MTYRRTLLVVLGAFLMVGCGAGDLPDGVDCTRVHSGGSKSSKLEQVLAAAEDGTCVVVKRGEFEGEFTVPAGVKLIGALGNTATFRGGPGDASVIRAHGGANTAVIGVTIVHSEEDGLWIEGGPVQVRDVTISDVAETALFVLCGGGNCGLVTVADSDLSTSRFGLWAYGAQVSVTNTQTHDHFSTSVAGGYGMVASNGAQLELQGVTVRDNEIVGLLIDGAGGTVATVTDSQIIDNLGRGLWAQGLIGTSGDPALHVGGVDMVVARNRMVGIGAYESMGIIVLDGLVADTIAVEVIDIGGRVERVGDGIGLFSNTGQVRIEGVTAQDNDRAQILIDSGAEGIIVLDGFVGPGTGDHGIVIQNTTASVDTGTAAVDTTQDLVISAKEFPLSTDAP